MPATTYDIVPGQSVGPFMLGDTLWHVLDLVRTDRLRFPKVELAWDTSQAHTSDITLTIPNSNLTLYFPHPGQRSSLLRITSVPSSNLTLAFENQVLHSSSQALSRGVVGRILGPTYSSGTAGSSLVYPGVKFDLLASSTASGGTGAGAGRDDRVESLTVVPSEEGVLPSITPLQSVTITPSQGITLQIPHEVRIAIGETTSQDLLLDLGPPLRKYVKEDDRMERIWGQARGKEQDGSRSTFWNYFQYGIDFLISPEGQVEKILLHSNIPGTPLFQRHARCPWTIPTSSGTLSHSSPLSAFRAQLGTGSSAVDTGETHLRVPSPPATTSNGKKNKKASRNPSPASSEGSEVKSSGFVPTSASTQKGRVGQEEGMLLDRVVEGGLDGVQGLSPSRLVEFDGLILEEDQASGGITSVLVFKAE